MNSQPTCAWNRPLSAPLRPASWSTWGECGSPSWSENAWCLRWSATHEITGPSIAAEPRIASVARTALPVLNARCVNRRWKPTVMPRPVATYMIANTIRSLQPSSLAHSCQPTRARQRIGSTVIAPVRKRSSRSLATGWTSSRSVAVAAIAGSVPRNRQFLTSGSFQDPMRRLLLAPVLAVSALALAAAPSPAIVGGHDAAAGAYPSIAEVHLGKSFLCTGTLIAPTWVLTAGHCGSITGAAVATPASWPAPLIDVRIGGTTSGTGEQVPVAQAIVEPDYLLTSGHDVTLLKLAAPSTQAPVKVSGAGETGLWAPATFETIVGWGTTSEGGDTPDTLQEAQVPVTTDADCAAAYSDFEADTMLCAGFPQGGVDTCQGDSGGPLFGHTSGGALKVVGSTSFGEGCARAGKPGVYARVGDSTLREWIRSKAPAGVD